MIDTDYSVEHMLQSGDYPRDRIHTYQAFDWEEYEKATDEILPRLIPHQDWFVVDFMGQAWEACQDWYVAQVYNTGIDQFFLEARQNPNKGGLDGWKDWSVINRVYKSWANKVFFRNQAQLYVTAQAEPVKDTDDRQIKAIFSQAGQRPKSQKQLGYQVHSILMMRSFRPGDITMTTVKDRERVPVEGQPLADFTTDYLIKVAGWEL